MITKRCKAARAKLTKWCNTCKSTVKKGLWWWLELAGQCDNSLSAQENSIWLTPLTPSPLFTADSSCCLTQPSQRRDSSHICTHYQQDAAHLHFWLFLWGFGSHRNNILVFYPPLSSTSSSISQPYNAPLLSCSRRCGCEILSRVQTQWIHYGQVGLEVLPGE